MDKISILIPSRLARDGTQRLFLERAVASVRAQTIADHYEIRIFVGVDVGTKGTGQIEQALSVRITESAGKSQAMALNAAASHIDGDFVCILEDDDFWHPQFLEIALLALEQCDFISSTQLELMSQSEKIIRINDFATPSGWVMRRHTWDRVGGFSEAHRWHLDNEWLGRLSEANLRRVHLAEATAPLNLETAVQIRPWLAKVLTLGGPSVELLRHNNLTPLVFRLVHPHAGTQRIMSDPAAQLQSRIEYDALSRRFGRIPW